jgi:hypothetical protein
MFDDRVNDSIMGLPAGTKTMVAAVAFFDPGDLHPVFCYIYFSCSSNHRNILVNPKNQNPLDHPHDINFSWSWVSIFSMDTNRSQSVHVSHNAVDH